MQNQYIHGGFIPALEGMRALAVLVVLLFHLDVSGFGGGYLGVDVFFVISGFIITRNILHDRAGGTFTLRDFYARRLRRLLPALVVTVALTLLLSAFLIPSQDLEQTARSSLFAVFSLANFYFWTESGYFAPVADTQALLHTWSLSVEEQFYLFWPAALLLLARRQWLLPGSIILLTLSLPATLLWRDTAPSAVFYLLPFRVHQLMAGAIVAIACLALPRRAGSVATALGTVGFLLLCVLPGELLSPAVGATLVSAAGFLLLLGIQSPVALRCFGNAPMQWVGQRSYALYLVHWPIIVLFQFATDFVLSGQEQLLLFLACFAAAVCLHELVEKPFRKRGHGKALVQRAAVPVTALLLFSTVLGAYWIIRHEGHTGPTLANTIFDVEEEKKLRREAVRMGRCNLQRGREFSDYDRDACATPDPGRANVLVIGDSHAADIYLMLSKAFPEVHFTQATADNCTALVDSTKIAKGYPACARLNELRFHELAPGDIDLVVLASVWTDRRLQPLAESVDYLHSLGRPVLVFGPRTTFAGGVPLLVSLSDSQEGLAARVRDSRIDRSRLLAKMRRELPGTEVVDMDAIQCSPNCRVFSGGRLLYFDEAHFTAYGAGYMAGQFRKQFDLPGFIAGLSRRL